MHRFFDISKLVMHTNTKLDSGGFGVIRIASFRGAKVAVKVSERHDGHSWPQSFCIELRILRRHRHPNAIPIHGAIIFAKENQAPMLSYVSLIVRMPVDPSGHNSGDWAYACDSARRGTLLSFPATISTAKVFETNSQT